MAGQYDLEERTERFARAVRDFVKRLPKDLSNCEYGRQVIRSSGSVGANYIEANEALGKRDFLMRIRISRKEVKESGYWLRLVTPGDGQGSEQEGLIKESQELLKIFSAILKASQGNP
ncbi:MAG: four helix bundle protein [Bacteroidota bacterium]